MTIQLEHQDQSSPLFPKLLWARPESRHSAGKLLLVGGTKQSFALPATLYASADRAGVGAARIVLPDTLSQSVKKLIPEALFAPSTPSGSFATAAYGDLVAESTWADGVFICNDIGNNSETLVLLEKFIGRYTGILAVPIGPLLALPAASILRLFTRDETLFYGNFDGWQRLFKHCSQPAALRSDMGVVPLAEQLSRLQEGTQSSFLCDYSGSAMVASGGRVSATPSIKTIDEAATAATVWWLQNPTKPFEVITTSLIDNPT
ncbi:MAG: ADP-dependent NAD(P)H-hydrate dehydratase / NAD(P)H-hydrate epimerase [Patescibacteria group bacterium]|nr:hypothetical protein [Candidatus Saccharibacteria bacterium]MDQ5963197.1 ADP-dependent NAD(P)H-hydrate dehydratase / NAD(P)H-hydrate epimerase [Patescibacteria group bacterium]